jgi:hypothetical protein
MFAAAGPCGCLNGTDFLSPLTGYVSKLCLVFAFCASWLHVMAQLHSVVTQRTTVQYFTITETSNLIE